MQFWVTRDYFKVMQAYRNKDFATETNLKRFYEKMGNVFEEVLEKLTPKLGFVTPSFCSKLLSIINPNIPVWDSQVRLNLGLSKSLSGSKETKIVNAIASYKKICE